MPGLDTFSSLQKLKMFLKNHCASSMSYEEEDACVSYEEEDA